MIIDWKRVKDETRNPKRKTRNSKQRSKQYPMKNDQNGKQPYDVEKRTFLFAKNVRRFIRKLPKTIAHIEDGKQRINTSGSVEANYIEANESFSKKDFIFRIKIGRKEAKESRYWLRLE